MKKEQIHITLDIQKLHDGYFLATSKEVQGLVAQAKTFEKTVEIAEDVAKKLLRAQSVRNKNIINDIPERIIYPISIQA